MNVKKSIFDPPRRLGPHGHPLVRTGYDPITAPPMPQKENLAVRESVDSVPELKRPCQLAQLSKTKELRPKYDFDTRR